MSDLLAVVYLICFALIAGGAFALMSQNLRGWDPFASGQTSGSRPRRHPEAPEPVNDVPYVDLSRERQPRLICGVADRITGLQLGADDCMVKPFSPKELEARIRCVLRRSERPGLQGR